MLQACLNGTRGRHEHPAVPLSAHELAHDARRCVSRGAHEVHVHPRDDEGRESLDPHWVGETVRALHGVCPSGVTTGLWICGGDVERRLHCVRRWDHAPPDLASVNLSEPGAVEVIETLLDLGCGVEAGLASEADAEALLASGLAPRCLRALVEVPDHEPEVAVDHAARIAALVERTDLPQLHHGEGIATWAVLRAALQRGYDVRVGLEDTTHLEDGSEPRDNGELVSAVATL